MALIHKAMARLRLLACVVLFMAPLRAQTNFEPPSINAAFPTRLTVEAGATIRFEVSATSADPIGYRWSVPGPILAGGESWIETRFDARNASTQIAAVTVFNRYGARYQVCEVHALASDDFFANRSDVYVITGEPLLLSFNTHYFVPPTLQWRKDGLPIPGATDYYFSKATATGNDDGNYRISTFDSFGQPIAISEPIHVRVQTDASKPALTQPPAEIHLTSEDRFDFSAEAFGPGQISLALHRQDGSVESVARRTNLFTINPVAGEFYLVGINNNGSTTSQLSRVILHPAQSKIVLSGEPVTNVYPTFAKPLTLKVDLLQGENVALQWYSNSVAIPAATNLSFQIPRVLQQNVGGYELRATNLLGAVSRAFYVNFDGDAPAFRHSLIGWVGEEGERATLIMEQYAQGPGLQWFRNGQKISGATNAWLDLVLGAETVGVYQVVFANDHGSITSNPATVTIRKPSNAPRDFRLVADQFLHYASKPPEPFLWAGLAGVHENAITFWGGNKIYRWSPQIEPILTLTDPIAGLPAPYSILDCVGDDSGVIDLLISCNGVPYQALVEKNASGFKVIAKLGDEIPGNPTLGIGKISNLARANGKLAFFVGGSDVGVGNSYCGLYLWDGTALRKWVDQDNPLLKNWVLLDPVRGALAFDGESAAFGARISDDFDQGIFRVDAAGNVQKIAARFDDIPGANAQMLGFIQQIAMQGDKTLFATYTFDDYTSMFLLEHSGSREPSVRVIAAPGSMTQSGEAISRFEPGEPGFGYLSDGSVLFTARTSAFTIKEPGLFLNSPAAGIFRSREGVITEEITAMHRLGGRRCYYLFLKGIHGSNYVFTSDHGAYTTLPGLPRPLDTKLRLERSENSFTASWTGDGWLQSTENLLDWSDQIAMPGAVTNDLSKKAVYFRVLHP
jgi:hypothetical protein